MTPGPVPGTVVVPGPAFTLRILHLSDLHEGQPGREALWRRRRGPGRGLSQEPGADRGRGRAVDLVCFTGDVASAGRREGPRGGERVCSRCRFVRELLRRLGFQGQERFFAVPGNRDMDRKIEVAWRGTRSGRGMRRTCRNS